MEKRTANLELALEQTASFGESLLVALKDILGRLNRLEGDLEQNAVFNASVPRILQEITERLVTLEKTLREEAVSGESADKAFRKFSERMDALRQSIPKILEEPHAASGSKPSFKPPEFSSAVDPSVPSKLKELADRILGIESSVGRLTAQGQNTLAGTAALDSLHSTLRSLAERINGVEVSTARLAAPQTIPFNPATLDPLKLGLRDLSDRIRTLETKSHQPPKPEIPADTSVAEIIGKLAERIRHLETRPQSSITTQAITATSHEHALAQASKLYPKTKTVIFVGTENFSDNIKYAYLAFLSYATGKDITASFLCSSTRQYEQLKTAGLPCISPLSSEWSSQDARMLMSAKVAVLGDTFHAGSPQGGEAYALLQGARFVQLWHGIPFKEIGLQNLFATRFGNIFLAEDLASCGPFDVLVTSAVTTRHEWERWFSFREFAPIGLPRTDIFFQNLSAHDLVNVDEKALAAIRVARDESRRIVLYAPTFRDHNPGWMDAADLQAFATHARDRSWLLYVNLHPREQGIVTDLRLRYPNIHFIEQGTDIFPIVKYTDCLVTDYSSLAFDFLYNNRPVVFYRPDHTDYITRARMLVGNIESLTVGPITSVIESTIAAVADVFDRPDMDQFRDARAVLRKKLFDYEDGKACTRLCTIIQRHLEPGIRFVPMIS